MINGNPSSAAAASSSPSAAAAASSPSADTLGRIAVFVGSQECDVLSKEAMVAQVRDMLQVQPVDQGGDPLLSGRCQEVDQNQIHQEAVRNAQRRESVQVPGTGTEVAPSNRGLLVSTPQEQEREMKGYRPFALTALGLVLTVAIFCLSNNVSLSSTVKTVVAALLLGMCFVSVMTVATAFAGRWIANTSDIESIRSSLCELDGAITVVSMGTLAMIIYVINIILVILYSFTKQSKLICRNLLFIGAALDVITVIAWISIWKRPKLLYSWKLMSALRDISWALGGWFFGFCGLCDAFKKLQRPRANATASSSSSNDRQGNAHDGQ